MLVPNSATHVICAWLHPDKVDGHSLQKTNEVTPDYASIMQKYARYSEKGCFKMGYAVHVYDLLVIFRTARCAVPGGVKTSLPVAVIVAWQLELWEGMIMTSLGRVSEAESSSPGRAPIESTLQPCMEPSTQARER